METKEYKELLKQAAQIKLEMNVLYDMYKNKRTQYESLTSQIHDIIESEVE